MPYQKGYYKNQHPAREQFARRSSSEHAGNVLALVRRITELAGGALMRVITRGRVFTQRLRWNRECRV
ncbi:MAG: hypothetical protein A2010_14600 [Nitrospirae bacterium GWD2_57_9]|nr:MAG: hypothetical protein A2010_14600 [Nitrospirae bacterium GWD2_57_9]